VRLFTRLPIDLLLFGYIYFIVIELGVVFSMLIFSLNACLED